MNRKFLFCLVICFLAIPAAFADYYVPEFDKMQTLRCDFEDNIYDNNNSLISQSKQFRLFRLDDEFNRIYLQKEPVDNVTYYDKDKIEFSIQSMTDDAIIMSHTTLDRAAGTYNSNSTLNYDNPVYGTRYSKASGSCRVL